MPTDVEQLITIDGKIDDLQSDAYGQSESLTSIDTTTKDIKTESLNQGVSLDNMDLSLTGIETNQTYLVRITSLANSNDISWCVDWYEHTNV